MSRRRLNWVNTPVLSEALLRYQENRLPKSLKLWIEKVLEINSKEDAQLLSKASHL